MAEVTSGRDLTVIILNSNEAEALRDLVTQYVEAYSEGAEDEDRASALYELSQAI